MRTLTSLAVLLGRGRRATAHGRIDALAVVAFATSAALLEVVLGGFHAFLDRLDQPPASLVALVPHADRLEGIATVWVVLAAIASVMLVVPIVTLGGAAARMGALGRDRRLAALRLLGATPAEVVGLTAAETALQALLGALAGTLIYGTTLPAWMLVVFQGQALSPAEMLLPATWLLGVVVGLPLLAAASAALGLREVRISPLGVARRAGRPRVGLIRLAVFVLVVVTWVQFGPMMLRAPDLAMVIGVIVGFLGAFLAVVNLVGPLLVRLLGHLMAAGGSTTRLLAGRRLLADPKGAWRSISGLAVVGFVAGAVLVMPMDVGGDPLGRLLAHDLQVGAALTIGIVFVVAAASTALNQVAALLDRRTELVQLDHTGAPRGLFHRVRATEVLTPTLFAAVGSAGLAVMFFGTALGAAAVGPSGVGLATLAGCLTGGVLLVWAASEACRPVLAEVLANAGPRVG